MEEEEEQEEAPGTGRGAEEFEAFSILERPGQTLPLPCRRAALPGKGGEKGLQVLSSPQFFAHLQGKTHAQEPKGCALH